MSKTTDQKQNRFSEEIMRGGSVSPDEYIERYRDLIDSSFATESTPGYSNESGGASKTRPEENFVRNFLFPILGEKLMMHVIPQYEVEIIDSHKFNEIYGEYISFFAPSAPITHKIDFAFIYAGFRFAFEIDGRTYHSLQPKSLEFKYGINEKKFNDLEILQNELLCRD